MSQPYGSGACAIPDCPVVTYDTGNLMCRPHWFSVPKELRVEVWRAYRRWQQGDGTLDQLRTAQEAAIAAITTVSANTAKEA